jgi:hypothetical protein
MERSESTGRPVGPHAQSVLFEGGAGRGTVFAMDRARQILMSGAPDKPALMQKAQPRKIGLFTSQEIAKATVSPAIN